MSYTCKRPGYFYRTKQQSAAYEKLKAIFPAQTDPFMCLKFGFMVKACRMNPESCKDSHRCSRRKI